MLMDYFDLTAMSTYLLVHVAVFMQKFVQPGAITIGLMLTRQGRLM